MKTTNNINTTEIITNTINTIFRNLFSSIDNNLYTILDDIIFINTDIINEPYFEKILGTSTSNGILLIANSLIIGFLLYYSIKLLLSHFIYSQIERPYQFIFKLIFFTILMNSSYFICEQLVFFNSTITLLIRDIGENLFNKNICFSELIQEINSVISINNSNFNVFSLDGLIKSIISLGLLTLIFSYSLRYIIIKVFILICPFAIISLLQNSTSYFFKSWFKCFISLLLLQPFISIILLIIFSIDFNEDLFSKILYIGAIYALIKANFFIRQLIGGISTDVNTNIRSLMNFKK